MHIYLAETKGSNFKHGWLSCVHWAFDQVRNSPDCTVRIFRCRAGEKFMRIVAEVSSDGLSFIEDGRTTQIKKADRRG